MPDVSFQCGVDFVRAVDSQNHQVNIRDAAYLKRKEDDGRFQRNI